MHWVSLYTVCDMFYCITYIHVIVHILQCSSYAVLFTIIKFYRLGTEVVAYYDKDRETICPTNCQLLVLVSSAGNRCDQCWVYRKTLFSLLTRHQRGQASHEDRTDPTSHVNYRFLSTPKKEGRLQRLHQLRRFDQHKISRLRAALDHAIEKRGVVVDEDLHQDQKQIIQEKEENILEMYPPGSFGRVFWENQM